MSDVSIISDASEAAKQRAHGLGLERTYLHVAPNEAPREAPGILVSEIIDFRSLAALAPAWDQLLEDSRADGIFSSPEWLMPWWQHFGKSSELRVLVARAVTPDGSSRLAGILPLVEVRENGLCRWQSMGTGVVGSDYLGMIARTGLESETAEAFVAHLAAVAGKAGIDLIELEDLLADCVSTNALASALTERFPRPPQTIVRHECPFVSLADFGRFPGAHLEASNPELAGQLRRKRKWLERRTGYAFRRLDSASGLEIWERLHTWRWALAGGSAATDGETTAAFHRDVAARLDARDRLRFYLIEAEGAPVAIIYGFERNTKLYYYQTGYDPSWGRRSVGGILLGLCLEEAERRGLSELDLLRGSEAYKFHFGSGLRKTVSLRVPTSMAGELVLTAAAGWQTMRRAIKRALPRAWRRPIVHAVRRLRGEPVSGDTAVGGP